MKGTLGIWIMGPSQQSLPSGSLMSQHLPNTLRKKSAAF